MNHCKAFPFAVGAALLCSTMAIAQPSSPAVYKKWMISPFNQVDAVNPILGPNFDSLFFDPIRKENVRWEARAIIGAAAIVKDDKLALIYHGEDSSNGFRGMRGTFRTFREGLAWSTDGLHFKRESQPVLYPDNGPMKEAEWSGGDEIPPMLA